MSTEDDGPDFDAAGSSTPVETVGTPPPDGGWPRERMSYDTHPDRVDSPSSYAAGWNDAKAGRQYGEGRNGPRVGARAYPVCLGMADGMCTRFADGANWCPDGTCEEAAATPSPPTPVPEEEQP